MTNPLICPPAEKAAIEARNSVNQLDTLTYWIERGDRELRRSHLLELQAAAVEGIYPCAGQLRDARHLLKISDGRHQPPPANQIDGHLVDLLDRVNSSQSRATSKAAFVLWRLNWIHPFNGGNGRTARAAAYFVLAADLNFMPPGSPSLPGLLKDDRDGYIDALRACDALYTEASLDEIEIPRCVLPMQLLVHKLYMQQIEVGVRGLFPPTDDNTG